MKRFTNSTFIWLFFTALLLGGCSVTPPSQLTPIDVSHANQASAWELKGKLAVKTPDDKFSTNLYWLHTQTHEQLTLTTMLGTTVLSLTSEPGKAILELDGKRYEDTNAERLLTQLSGWAIPLEKLPLWITGQLSPDDILVATNEDGTPRQLLNEMDFPAWQVDLLSWQTQSGAQIPQQLKLNRGTLLLRIQINQWQALGNTK